jgi:zona occludens toxin (predicted ATPase)
VTDPTDEVHPDNVLTTCQECHKQATLSFTQFQPHGNTRDQEKYPALWWVAKIMVWLVIVVLLFFYTHSMLWF